MKLEGAYQGSIAITCFILFNEVHFTKGGTWLEDMIFGDLKTNYRMWYFYTFMEDNIKSYSAYIVCIPVFSAV